MTFNFGGGLAGGFAQGLQIGGSINDLMKQDAVEKVRAQGIAEARAMQAAQTPGVTDQGDQNNLASRPQASADPAAPAVNADIAASPMMAGLAPAQTSADPAAPLSGTPAASADPAAAPAAGGIAIRGGKRFLVGDTGFDTADEAHAHAAKNAPDINDMMRKTLVPKMQAVYMEQGDVAKADAWGAWAKSKEGEKKAELWGRAFTQAQRGNFEEAAGALAKLHADLDDGRTYIGQDNVKDKDGNLTGFNMKYKDDATGEEKSQFVDKHALVEMGLSSLSPQAMFEQSYKQQNSADGLMAKARVDSENDQRTAARQAANAKAIAAREAEQQKAREKAAVDLEDRKSTNRKAEKQAEREADLADVAPKLKAKADAEAEVMRSKGASEEEIKKAIVRKYVDGDYKKGTDPQERQDLVISNIIKSDAYLMAKPDKQAVMLANAKKEFPGRAAGTEPAAAAGVAKPAPKTSGTPVWDSKSNKMVYR